MKEVWKLVRENPKKGEQIGASLDLKNFVEV